MGRIKALHPELGTQFTRTTADAAAAAVTSSVENTTSFGVNDLAVYGKPGEERTEIIPITSVTPFSTLGHSSGLDFAHGAQTKISQIKYDQIEISRATSQGGSYSVLTTINITIDEPATYYDDLTGTSTSWYKIRYKNSVTAAFSDYSVEIQATGYDEDSLSNMTEEVLEDANDEQGEQVTPKQVRRYLRTAVRRLVLRIIKVVPDYHRNRATQALTSGTNFYNVPTRFLAFLKVVINPTGSTEADGSKATFETEDKGEPNTQYNENDPRIVFRANQWGIRPTPTSSNGYAFLYYWDYPAVMTDDDDTHGLGFGARDALVAYALYKVWKNKDEDIAARYKKDWEEIGDEFIEFMSQSRQFANNKSVEVIFGDDLYEDE